MKKVVAGLLALCFRNLALADQVVLSWPPVASASTYVIYSSVDQGQNWVKLIETASATVTYDAPGDKLVLFRVSAKNPQGESIAVTKGVWYNGAWSQVPSRLTIH